VVGGDGALVKAEVKQDLAVFRYHGARMIGQKGLNGASQIDGGDGCVRERSGGHLLRWSAPAPHRASETLPVPALS
jgi:hypothetical protein